MASNSSNVDDIIIGAGHNGLTAAAYLARAGRRVLVLERADHVGGAAVSATPFAGVPARLSRYSYLVSLMPTEIIADLGLDLRLIRRRYSSYTPLPADPTRGVLVDTAEPRITQTSIGRVTDPAEYEAWTWLYRQLGKIAEHVFGTLTEPLRSRDEIRALAAGTDSTVAEVWELLTERPLSELLERYLRDDLLRGIAATDGLIGTFADLADPSLRQNICFLYHLIGGGTGDWDVPVGGMGAVTGALYEAATSAGARIRTGVDITAIDPHDGVVESDAGTFRAEMLYAACAPTVIDRLVEEPISTETEPRGAQLKINVLLDRLPRLRDDRVEPEQAFAGTFHVNEGYDQLRRAWVQADRGEVPDVPPCEIYCHTLSDRSILGPELAGMHTLTIFGLHMPPEVFDQPGALGHALDATLSSINSVLAEPVQSLIARDADGNRCVEVKTPQDLEETLGMPGGNIFHRSLQWPWAESDAELGTWGVETRYPRMLLCGAGGRRGGGVSGIPGRNAAAAVLTD